MIFTDHQRMMFKTRALILLSKFETWRYDKDGQVGQICAEFEVVCSTGYSIALDEVCSTPWEYLSHPILTDAARNDAIMNGMASQGWELQFVGSGWHFWRRRKAVAEIAAESKTE